MLNIVILTEKEETMKLTYVEELKPSAKVDALVIGVYESFKNVTKEETEQLKRLKFSAKPGETAVLPGNDRFRTFIYVGLGKKTALKEDSVRLAAAKALKKARSLKAKRVVFELLGEDKLKAKAAKALAEGIVLGSYQFSKYKSSEDSKFSVDSVTVAGLEDYRESFELGRVLAEAANFTRSVVDEPGNVVTPAELARIAKELSKEYDFDCKVFDEKKLEKRKMVGILAVGGGSSNPPRFIHIAYKPKNAKKRIVLVGKGVTFDSGGILVT